MTFSRFTVVRPCQGFGAHRRTIVIGIAMTRALIICLSSVTEYVDRCVYICFHLLPPGRGKQTSGIPRTEVDLRTPPEPPHSSRSEVHHIVLYDTTVASFAVNSAKVKTGIPIILKQSSGAVGRPSSVPVVHVLPNPSPQLILSPTASNYEMHTLGPLFVLIRTYFLPVFELHITRVE